MHTLRITVFAFYFIPILFTVIICASEKGETQNVNDDKVEADDAFSKEEDVYVEEIVASPKAGQATGGSFYDYQVKDSDGKDVDLNKYRGKISLVVNVASECGYTDNHYRALSKIHNHLSPTGRFTVLAFPCNQFGKQEPGTNEDIQKFVKEKYKVKFPVFGKINVIESDVPPAWKYLIGETEAPNWNFFKYLVNENGEVLDAWGPWTSVDEIYSLIQEAVSLVMKKPHTEL